MQQVAPDAEGAAQVSPAPALQFIGRHSRPDLHCAPAQQFSPSPKLCEQRPVADEQGARRQKALLTQSLSASHAAPTAVEPGAEQTALLQLREAHSLGSSQLQPLATSPETHWLGALGGLEQFPDSHTALFKPQASPSLTQLSLVHWVPTQRASVPQSLKLEQLAPVEHPSSLLEEQPGMSAAAASPSPMRNLNPSPRSPSACCMVGTISGQG